MDHHRLDHAVNRAVFCPINALPGAFLEYNLHQFNDPLIEPVGYLRTITT